MKKSIYLLLFMIIPLLAASNLVITPEASDADMILGNWQPSNGRSVVKIYKGKNDGEDPNKYYGKIIWLKEPNDESGEPRKDVNNEEESLQGKPLKGLVIIKDLEFDEVDGKDIVWDDGTIYDPNNGTDYRFKATINKKNKNTMAGKGYIGVSLFGREDTWTRLVKK